MRARTLVVGAVVSALALGLASSALAVATVFTGVGSSASATALSAFEAAIGGANNGSNPPQAAGFRAINWDGVPAASAAPNLLAANFFNAISPRGAVLSTAGTGFEVSGATADGGAGQPAAANFGNIDPSYTTTFTQFSSQRLFISIGSNVYDVNFFRAGTAAPGYSKGFGAIFSNVDNANTSTIQYFDQNNASLGTFSAPVCTGANNVCFLGVVFTPGSIVSRVRVTNGNAALGPGVVNATPAPDVVVNDDFAYGEPLATPTAVTVRSFSAHRVGHTIRLRWSATSAALAGFNVYREQYGRRTRLNRRLILADGSPAGSTYTWLAPLRTGARYWLQVVQLRGAGGWYGPVRA